jgi:hypothetical protein
MAHQNAQWMDQSTRERDDSQAEYTCPACEKPAALKRRTKVAIATADKFPQEHMVVEAVTCEHCGCVSLYNPSAIKRDASSSSPS